MDQARVSYDISEWNTLLRSDEDVASAAKQLRPFGERHVDALAEAYLAIGEKRYLPTILAKLLKDAEHDRRRAPAAPEFDVAEWRKLLAADRDVAAASATVGEFGGFYVADLAASLLAIGDTTYLQRIVDKIVATAKLDADQHSAALAASQASEFHDTISETIADAVRRDYAALESDPAADQHNDIRESNTPPPLDRATSDPQTPTAPEFLSQPPRGGVPPIAWASVAALSFLILAGSGFALNDYLQFNAAHGSGDRIADYLGHCHLCIFKDGADAELKKLQNEAADRERVRLHNEAATREAARFQAAHGDVDAMIAYVVNCKVCAFRAEAVSAIASIREEIADEAAARKKAQEANAQKAAMAQEADQRAYRNAGDDLFQLRKYLQLCTVCAFRQVAQSRIDEFESQQRARDLARQEDEQRARDQAARLAMLPQPDPNPHQISWKIINNAQTGIAISFFSMTRHGHAWPGSNMSWPMTPSQSQQYNLACEPDEKICFGASVPSGQQQWGVGALGTLGCNNCCVTCDGLTHTNNLIDGTYTAE